MLGCYESFRQTLMLFVEDCLPAALDNWRKIVRVIPRRAHLGQSPAVENGIWTDQGSFSTSVPNQTQNLLTNRRCDLYRLVQRFVVLSPDVLLHHLKCLELPAERGFKIRVT